VRRIVRVATLLLLRHGDAEDGDGDGDDAARRLTPKGDAQAEAAGRALAALGVEVDACLASTRVRAMETARIACRSLGIEPEPSEELRGGPFDGLGLASGRGRVLLVGHEPDLSGEVARLSGARVRMKKGGLAIVDRGALLALLRPRDLSAIAASESG
jgi:phosphohistidine phosphatase